MSRERHALALAWARSKDGEGEVPPGSNTGPFVVQCQRATDLGGTRWPWCVAFYLAAWLYGANYRMPYRGASAFGFLAWAQQNGWAVDAAHAVPGDGVILAAGAGHCAMLTQKVIGDQVPTISGNYGDKVTDHTFQLAEVKGFIHVPLDKIADRTPPAKPPIFDVVTSISGHKKLVYASGANAISRKIAQILNRRGGVTISRRKSAGAP